jgi:uncharacterized protein with PIN domain
MRRTKMNNTQIADRLKRIKDSLESISEKVPDRKAKSKHTFTCPNCYAKAWAKPGSRLVCGGCLEDIDEIFEMDEEG